MAQTLDADVIVIGSGLGGLVTATQLAAKGASVIVLERYLIAGGSGGYFERNGYRFDVGASMIFGFGDRGTTNLLTRALAAVNMKMETIADPVQIHYHLPNNLEIEVHRDYEEFLKELGDRFPDEREGIRKFYDECWKIFNCLNAIELLSLEEWRYLMRVFFQNPLACLGLAAYLPQNAGDIAKKYIRDPELLQFIDMECYCWSVVPADRTPAINAGMVFSDRHYGGINYPVGGVGKIAEKLAEGLDKAGGEIRFGARVTQIIPKSKSGKGAIGVKLANGEILYAKKVVSNATRWDTFGNLLKDEPLPNGEKGWQSRYQKSPSFLSLHLGVEASAIPDNAACHHILLEDWNDMQKEQGTIFVSIPTLLDRSLAPEGRHIVHTFTPSWMSAWEGLSSSEYEAKKNAAAKKLCDRLLAIFPKLEDCLDYQEIGTPRSHRRFLGRADGTYGPIPAGKPWGLLGMPFNSTSIPDLYCVGDSTFPGQGLNAVAFSGFACGHLVASALGLV